MSFTVYKSSAGSGKTYTLVKEYLKIALSEDSSLVKARKQRPRYTSILAITFTNKAAAEMKSRVIKALKILAALPNDILFDENYLNDITEATQLEAVAVRERAIAVLSHLLHHYTDFAISTIDKFVHRVIRTFARDLHLSVDFEVEMELDEMLAQAVDALIAMIGTDNTLTNVLVRYTEDKMDEEKSWDINADLQDFAKQLLKEEAYSQLPKLRTLTINDFLETQKKIGKLTGKYENTLKELGNSAMKLIRDKGINHESLYQGEKGIVKYFDYMATGKMDKVNPNSFVQKTINEGKWYGGKATEDEKSSIDAVKGELIEAYQGIQEIIEKGHKKYSLYKYLNKHLYALAVLNEIEKIVEEFKKEKNILPIADFNKEIASVVMYEPAPFIYERLGEKYKHYLIDEFQDTSVMQWQNLLPLMENSLATGNFNMIVGDGKQAIYRWRDGEVEQFAKLPEVNFTNDDPFLLERADTLKRNYEEKVLQNNFRSKVEVVQFNNRLFKELALELSPAYQLIYQDIEQKFNADKSGGYVNIKILEPEEDETYDELTMERILHLINQCAEENYELKDIAILCRGNIKANAIVNFLMEHHISVISSESLLIAHSSAVQFIIAWFRFLYQPSNTTAQKDILEYLVLHKQLKVDMHATLSSVLLEMEQNLPDFLSNNGYEVNIIALMRLPLYEIAEYVSQLFGLQKTVNPYLLSLMDAVHQYSSQQDNLLDGFLDWWKIKQRKLSVIIPEGMNAVNVMTVHKAKGLEFPVVIFPYVDWKIKNSKDHLWLNIEDENLAPLTTALMRSQNALKETEFAPVLEEEVNKSLLDNLNLLYVACTRPVERLYMMTSAKEDKSSISFLLMNAIKKWEGWDEEKQEYQAGEELLRQNKGLSSLEKDEPLLFDKLATPKQKGGLSIRLRAPEMWEAGEEKRDSTVFYGKLMHKALAYIKTVKDINPSLNMMMFEGTITQEEQKHLKENIHQLLLLPEVMPFFKEGLEVFTEHDILLTGGKTLRPDRVVIEKDKATVIDYKTGQESPHHKEQLGRYAEVLSKMGYGEVEKYLIYIGDVVKVF